MHWGGGSQVGEVSRLGEGNPPVHTISPFNLMTFKWWVGLPDRVTPVQPGSNFAIQTFQGGVARLAGKGFVIHQIRAKFT